MFGLPDFSEDIDEFRTDLKAIRNLLERLVALEETNAKGKK